MKTFPPENETTGMNEGLSLERVFELQDDAAQFNIVSSSTVRRRLEFLRGAVSLLTSVVLGVRFNGEKQHAIRILSADALSSLVTSVRVGLWGNFPESFSLLRSAIETATILTAVVRSQQYKTATYELGRKMDKLSFENSLDILDDTGQRIKELHGRISDIASHASSTRLKFESYTLDGETYDRLGFAYDPESAEMALAYTLDACLQVAYALQEAYQQDNLPFGPAPQLLKLIKAYEEARPWAK